MIRNDFLMWYQFRTYIKNTDSIEDIESYITILQKGLFYPSLWPTGRYLKYMLLRVNILNKSSICKWMIKSFLEKMDMNKWCTNKVVEIQITNIHMGEKFIHTC